MKVKEIVDQYVQAKAMKLKSGSARILDYKVDCIIEMLELLQDFSEINFSDVLEEKEDV